MSRIPWGYRIGAALSFALPFLTYGRDIRSAAFVLGTVAAAFILMYAYEAHK